ncbi:MAG: ankyrin repeat domain-containing protein [Treponema sp.]|jgi:hypothetical protein|nr:ankyrin repeat domain-containing protein [Treponema sp.]
MNWLILLPGKSETDAEYERKTACYTELLEKKHASYTVFNEEINSSAASLQSFLTTAAEATHCIIVKRYRTEAEIADDFVPGYICGRNVPGFVEIGFKGFCDTSSDGLRFFQSSDDIIKDIDANYRLYQKDETQKAAFKALFDAGIPFTADSFATYIATDNRYICRLFLAAGMGINCSNSEGTPMLNVAARNEQYECVKWLLKNGADINGVSKDRGYSAVMDSVWKKDRKITELLISQRADLSFISRDGQPILVLAVGIGDAEICRLLVEHGADPDVKDSMGMSAYGYAVLFRKPKIVEILKKYHKE